MKSFDEYSIEKIKVTFLLRGESSSPKGQLSYINFFSGADPVHFLILVENFDVCLFEINLSFPTFF